MCVVICRWFKDGPHWHLFSKFTKKFYPRASQNLFSSTAEQKQQQLPTLSRSWLDACSRMVPLAIQHLHLLLEQGTCFWRFFTKHPQQRGEFSFPEPCPHPAHLSLWNPLRQARKVNVVTCSASLQEGYAAKQGLAREDAERKQRHSSFPTSPRGTQFICKSKLCQKRPRFAMKNSLFLVSKQITFDRLRIH